MKVYKFGGASVKDVEGIINLGKIVSGHHDQQLVVVVSAMGKTTNALEEVTDAFFEGRSNALDLLQVQKEAHKTLAATLDLSEMLSLGVLDDFFAEAEWLLEDAVQDPYDYVYDQIVAIGELLSTRLVQGHLQNLGLEAAWIDARDIIKTDDTYRTGIVDWDKTSLKVEQLIRPLLDQGKIVVIPGFIGSTQELNTSTLGREGSDYSAAILASMLKAESLTIWKDVPGVMTADPDLIPSAKVIDHLSYREAIEMTYHGAKVIHPKTINPLIDLEIPLIVRSFLNVDHQGTLVSGEQRNDYPPMQMLRKDQCLITMSAKDHGMVDEEALRDIFQNAVHHQVPIRLMQHDALKVSLVVDNSPRRISAFMEALEHRFVVSQELDVELLTIRHYTEDLLKIAREGVEVRMESYHPETMQLAYRR